MASNAFPIVLVHGFAGWGREELLGIKYWGGIQGDVQEQLKAQGHAVFTATVGPFSSNWDRACELYAQIKGGQVDYGANHSTHHGHARFGRTFPGLYPQWGDVGADGTVNKIHLVGHSMGGQTIRMLTQLLNHGSKGAPVVEEVGAEDSLFAGGKDWVHSITTISTPNQGTLLADGFEAIGDVIKSVIVGVFSTFNVVGALGDELYDAKLDQWGISPKQDGESLRVYLARVFNSKIFAPGFEDMALWSLSTGGAAEESTWVETLPGVFYFSFATVDTHASFDLLLETIQRPNLLTMFAPLQPLGLFLGGRYTPRRGFSEEWQANDGVVNAVSMLSDGIGEYVPFEGVAKRGVWNGMPTLEPMDHLAVVGITIHTNVLKKLYSAHAKLLTALPVADVPATETLQKTHVMQLQVARNNLKDAVVELREEAVAAAKSKAEMRRQASFISIIEQDVEDTLASFAAWNPSHSVRPVETVVATTTVANAEVETLRQPTIVSEPEQHAEDGSATPKTLEPTHSVPPMSESEPQQ